MIHQDVEYLCQHMVGKEGEADAVSSGVTEPVRGVIPFQKQGGTVLIFPKQCRELPVFPEQCGSACVIRGTQINLPGAARLEHGQGILEYQPSPGYDADAAGGLFHFRQEVAGYHYRHSKLFRKAFNQLPHLVNTGWVQPVGGFIQKYQFWGA